LITPSPLYPGERAGVRGILFLILILFLFQVQKRIRMRKRKKPAAAPHPRLCLMNALLPLPVLRGRVGVGALL
jgi:hypothetical protein